MLTIPEFLASLQREADITKHLVSKLDAGHLDHRLTEKQRSLGELIEYLAIQLEGCVAFFVTGSWDRWEALDKEVKGLTPSAFPAAMDRQLANVERLLAGADLNKLVPLPPGGEAPLGVALLEFTLKFAVTYKAQLFLQAKHAGLGNLKSSNLWGGKDS